MGVFALGALGGYALGTTVSKDDAESGTEQAEAFLAGLGEGSGGSASQEAQERGYAAGTASGRKLGSQRGRLAGEAAAELARTPPERERVRRPGTPTGPDPNSTGEVLVVGDSLEELSGPYLAGHLPNVDLTISAEGGYNSYQIFDLFEASFVPSQRVVVFDAGTNDNPSYPDILASNLAAVAEAIGDRCMVVPTIHAPPVDGVDSSGKNEVVRAFAASRPGTQVPDWAAAVAAHPELMQPDNLHPLAEGADLRARLIAEGISACLAQG